MQCLEPCLQPLPELTEYEKGAYSGFISLPKHTANAKVHTGASPIAGIYPRRPAHNAPAIAFQTFYG